MSILQPLESIIREAIQDLIFITFLYGFLFIFSFIVFIFGAKIPLDLFLTVFSDHAASIPFFPSYFFSSP